MWNSDTTWAIRQREYLIKLYVHCYLVIIQLNIMKICVGLYLHDCSFDLVSSVVHVERELCPDPARVLNQTDSGAMSGHVQGVHDLQHRRRSGTFI